MLFAIMDTLTSLKCPSKKYEAQLTQKGLLSLYARSEEERGEETSYPANLTAHLTDKGLVC
jgi:hypothetical protein